MHWRGKLEHTDYVLKGDECTTEESTERNWMH